jgi:hypothetical protein
VAHHLTEDDVVELILTWAAPQAPSFRISSGIRRLTVPLLCSIVTGSTQPTEFPQSGVPTPEGTESLVNRALDGSLNFRQSVGWLYIRQIVDISYGERLPAALSELFRPFLISQNRNTPATAQSVLPT